MKDNEQIIKAAGLTTADVTSGLLSPEQSSQFIKQIFDKTTIGGLIRHEMRKSKVGQLDKIGIASRILRKKTENIDATSSGGVPIVDSATGQITGYRAKPNFSQVDYSTTDVRLPWETTEETLRQNIEGQSFEETVTNLMTTQLAIDLEDLYLNGDTAISTGNADHDFYYINDGWIKQISNGGHVVDATGLSFDLNLFYRGLEGIPNKYNNGTLRWIISPNLEQKWSQSLYTQALSVGGTVTDTMLKSPAGIPIVVCPQMPNDKILLADPKNFVVVNTYGIQIRKTIEGKEAIMADKRFYVIHLDFDAIIEELDATAVITNIGAELEEEEQE